MIQSQCSRLFFALWPSQALQAQLLNWQKLITHGQLVPAERLHITLAFLGDVSKAQFAPLVGHAGKVQSATFDLSLDRAGFFRRPQIAWVGPRTVPAALIALHRDLVEVAHFCGLRVPNERFTPHVTLARKATPPLPAEPPAPAHWQVEAFHLMQSQLTESGPEYHFLRSFPLNR